jgi:predicted small metal-binding protein
MRVIDCNVCGATIKAANDEELAGQLRAHMKAQHQDVEWDPEEAADLVAQRAYAAVDS